MPLDGKCVELINQDLDHIPVNSAEDFILIIHALKNIIQPQDEIQIPEESIKIKEFISSISQIYNDPELLYVKPEFFPEFQKKIQERILKVIDDFEKMSLTQKEAYIHNQQSLRATIQAADTARRNITENKVWQDKQEAHNTGEAETLMQELQRRQYEFQEEANAIITLQEAGISADQIATMPPIIRSEFIQNSTSILRIIMQGHISVEQLITMNSIIRTEFLENIGPIMMLITEANISVEQLVAMESKMRNEFLKYAYIIIPLMTRGVHITLEQFLEIEPEICTLFLKNAHAVSAFLNHTHLSFDQLVTMDPEIRAEILIKPYSFIKWNKNISLEQLERLSRGQVHTVLSDPYSAESIEILSALKRTSRKPWGKS